MKCSLTARPHRKISRIKTFSYSAHLLNDILQPPALFFCEKRGICSIQKKGLSFLLRHSKLLLKKPEFPVYRRIGNCHIVCVDRHRQSLPQILEHRML